MRIVYIGSSLNIHDYRFLEKLANSRHDAWLISYYTGKSIPAKIRELPNLNIVHFGYPWRYDLRRLDWRVLPWQILFALLRGFINTDDLLSNDREGTPLDARHPLVRLGYLAAARQYRHLMTVLHSIQPDVVHSGPVNSTGFLAAATGFCPLLIMPWGSDILVYPKRWKRERTLAKYTLQRADMITCNCEALKEEIIAMSGYPAERIIIVPHGVDLNVFKPDSAQRQMMRARLSWSDNKIIVMTRNYWPVYAVDDFLRALPAVVKAEPEVRVFMVGSGKLERKLKRLADELGLASYLRWAGFVENSQIPQYLNAADLYVSSSLSDGTANSHLEAMACKLPIILTDVPSSFEWITDGFNGRIVPRRNPATLATAIIELLQDSELRETMAERNLAIARERADWDKNFARLEWIYESLYQEFNGNNA